MRGYKAEAMGWDFNGPIIKGYPEITAAYRMMFESLNNFDFKRFRKLCFDTQGKCWKLTIEGRLDELAYVMTKDVFDGESFGFLHHYFNGHDISKTLTNKALRNLPWKLKKLGGKIDARVNDDSMKVINILYDDGVENFAYSASFKKIVEGVLKRQGVFGKFKRIYANILGEIGEDGRLADYAHDKNGKPIDGAFLVDPTDKSRYFRDALAEMKLNPSGEKVAYIDDSPQGKNIFSMVEFPIVDPSAKQEFKDECRDDADFGNRIFVPQNRTEILDHLSTENKKIVSTPGMKYLVRD